MTASNTASFSKFLATTHALVFLAGLAAGKSWNSDELAAFRSARDEDVMRKLKKFTAKITFGVVAIGIGVVGLRARRSS